VKLSATSTTYPAGATIDARGFTGNKVCASGNITTMLFQCVPQGSSTGAIGGKLLLGNVNLYADGPASGHYTDNIGPSGIGTPALIIPSFFWGIEGMSRGATGTNSTPGTGTFLSVCLGSNSPVTGCTTPFPVRSFSISSTSVSVNTMTINLSSSVTSGTNVYFSELAMVKGSSTASDNGTYKIQNITNGTGSGSVTVTVPTGTPGCSAPGCGTMYLGTPILGFASSNYAYNASYCFSHLCSGFGQHIKDLRFNCQGAGTQPTGDVEGCIGWQNLYAEEESGADTFLVTNYNFVGVDIHGGPENGSQNFGPVLNAEVYTGTSNQNCDFGTTGIYIGDSEMRGLNGWTVNQSTQQPNPASQECRTNNPIAAVMLDAMNTEVRNGHCEGATNCVLVGANNGSASGGQISGVSGGPSGNAGTNVVQISANYSGTNGNYLIERIRKNQHTNGIMDNINNVTLSNNFISLYSYAGIRTGAVATGVSANTDLAGQCTVGITTCPTYSFTQTYTSAPICTCSDTSGVNACRVQIAVGTPTTLTITGTSGHTINYLCIGRN
jgi:hypothetical protein